MILISVLLCFNPLNFTVFVMQQYIINTLPFNEVKSMDAHQEVKILEQMNFVFAEFGRGSGLSYRKYYRGKKREVSQNENGLKLAQTNSHVNPETVICWQPGDYTWQVGEHRRIPF